MDAKLAVMIDDRVMELEEAASTMITRAEHRECMTSCIAAVRKIYEGDIAHMEDALRKCGYF